MTVGIVIIGRNEGERFKNCVRSLQGRSEQIVYVDSGSTDDSVKWALDVGLKVEILTLDQPFTAARARNAGYRHLIQYYPDIEFIQFIDGDCQLAEGWLNTGLDFLKTHPDIAIVFGRRREQFPDASIYNTMCDLEWNTPLGERDECGGDCLVRRSSFDAAGGYQDDLIAGEEPELCLRLRGLGWKVWRLDAEMTQHDADMHKFKQWWQRSVRAGHAYAEVSWRHRASPKRIWQKNVRRAMFWGTGLPLLALFGGLFHPAVFSLLLLYPIQVCRLVLRNRKEGSPTSIGIYTVLGKFPEAQGVLKYHFNRALHRKVRIIEYK